MSLTSLLFLTYFNTVPKIMLISIFKCRKGKALFCLASYAGSSVFSCQVLAISNQVRNWQFCFFVIVATHFF